VDKTYFLQAGEIVNTFGVHGELKINPWTDSPAFLANIKTFFINDKPIKLVSSRVHKNYLLVTLEGINDFDSAIKLKNKIVYISRDDVHLEDGRFFIADLIGLRAVDYENENEIGVISDYLSRPANDVYVIITENQNEILIPAIPQFVKEINQKAGYIKFHLLEGL